MAKIVDMFYRATDRAKGSGLGLYIVKEILERFGGTISVRSEPSAGTTFRIAFPFNPEA